MNLPTTFNSFRLRQASEKEADSIWILFQEAIEKRRLEGSTQWQDGYPNRQVIAHDIKKGQAYVAVDRDEEVVGYISIILEKDPAYEVPMVQWLTDRPYAVVHRLAVSQTRRIKGLATWMMQGVEHICRENNRLSIKADTNFDNIAMLRVFEKLGYVNCGIVYMRGSERQAFEKKLDA